MWNDFMFSVGAILPVFGVMVLGFLLRRRGFLTQGFCQTGNRLVFNLCLPAMLLRQIASMGGVRAADGGFLLYAFAATLAGVLAVWLPAHFFMKDKTQVGAFAQGAFRGNTALLGAALLQSICGSQAYAPSSFWRRCRCTTCCRWWCSVWRPAAAERWTAPGCWAR